MYWVTKTFLRAKIPLCPDCVHCTGKKYTALDFARVIDDVCDQWPETVYSYF